MPFTPDPKSFAGKDAVTTDTVKAILAKLDQDLAQQIVCSAVSLSYDKFVETLLTVGDVMYFRASMKAKGESDTGGLSVEEIRELLRAEGWKI